MRNFQDIADSDIACTVSTYLAAMSTMKLPTGYKPCAELHLALTGRLLKSNKGNTGQE